MHPGALNISFKLILNFQHVKLLFDERLIDPKMHLFILNMFYFIDNKLILIYHVCVDIMDLEHFLVQKFCMP